MGETTYHQDRTLDLGPRTPDDLRHARHPRPPDDPEFQYGFRPTPEDFRARGTGPTDPSRARPTRGVNVHSGLSVLPRNHCAEKRAPLGPSVTTVGVHCVKTVGAKHLI